MARVRFGARHGETEAGWARTVARGLSWRSSAQGVHLERGLLEEAFIRRAIALACTATHWSVQRTLPVSERWARAIDEHRICIDGGGIALQAWLDADVDLWVRVHIAAAWSAAEEKLLFDTVDEHPSLVAGLLVIHWPSVRSLCQRSALRSAARRHDAALVQTISSRRVDLTQT
jgi:hypothetical protein